MSKTRFTRVSPIPLGIPKGIGQQVDAPFKVTAITSGNEVTSAKINYGTAYINGKFISSNTTIGQSTTISCSASMFIYLRLNNSFSRTRTPSIDFISSYQKPEDYVSPSDPMTGVICLAYIDSQGRTYDLRPFFIVDRFSFLA